MTINDDNRQSDCASPFEDSYNENRTSRPPAPPSYFSAREVSPDPSNDRNTSTTLPPLTSSRNAGGSSSSRFGSLVTGSGWGIPGSSQAPPSNLRSSSTAPQQSRQVARSQRESYSSTSNTHSSDLPPPSRQQVQQRQELDYEQREYLQYQQQQQQLSLQQQQPQRSVGSNVGTALQDRFAEGRIGGLMGMQPSYGPGPSSRGGGGLLGLGLLGGRNGGGGGGYSSDGGGGGGGRGGLLGLGLVGGRRERRRARRNGWG